DEYLHGIYQNQEAYFAVWNQGQRRPIRVRRYRGPNAVFDTYSYPRGSAVIHMLRSVLGEELFWKSIRYYLKKHQYQSVGTDDFVVAIEEATGQNLEWFFDQWIYNMGHPEFEVSSSYDENSKKLTLRVKQTQKADSQRTWYNSPEFFIVPMDIGITTASGEKIERIIIDAVEKEFTFDLDSKPLIVNFDRGNAVIKQVKFDRSEEELIYQLLHDNDTIGRFRACLELRSKKNDTVAKALAEAARQDKFWGVRTRATDYLAEYRNDFSKAKLLELAKDGDSRVRRSAVRALAFAEDPNLADLFKELVKNEQSYNVLEEAARGLGATKSADAYDALAELLGQDSWQDAIRGAALLGFSQLKDPRSVDLMLKYAKPGNRVSMRSSAIFALAQLAKSDDRLYEVLTLAVRDESLQILFAAVQSLLSIGDTKAVSLLEEAAARKDLPAGAIDFLNNNIKRLKEVNSKKEQEDKKNEGVQ
ncbi:MAG: DUF3458 domain-containing protein, partial [Blastocatellia bacterium]|nr:DUF3458 domain-containing protein [Blastocatellia bacterium]